MLSADSTPAESPELPMFSASIRNSGLGSRPACQTCAWRVPTAMAAAASSGLLVGGRRLPQWAVSSGTHRDRQAPRRGGWRSDGDVSAGRIARGVTTDAVSTGVGGEAARRGAGVDQCGNVDEVRPHLLPKEARVQQSHEIALRIRPEVEPA